MQRFHSSHRERCHVHILPTDQFKTTHVSIRLVTPVEREKVTTTALLPYLWMEGTRQYPSAREIMMYTDELYGSAVRTAISKRADRHVAEVYASSPYTSQLAGAENLPAQIQQLAFQVLTDPFVESEAFPNSHVDRERTLHRRRIESVFDDKISYAMERCWEEMYNGQATGLPRLGFVDDLATINGHLLYQHHQTLLDTAEVHMYVVGHIKDVKGATDALFQFAHEHLGVKGQGALPPILPTQARSSVNDVTEEQDVTQGKLNLGYKTGVSYNSPEYPALLVMNGVFGGFAHSKLFVNVREKASLAYFAQSRLDGLTGAVTVQTGIEIENFDQAMDIISKQVAALQNGEVTDDELEFTKLSLKSQYQQAFDQPMAMANVHFSGALAGIHREVGDLLDMVDKVTKDEVVSAAANLKLDTVYFLRGERGVGHE